MSDGALARLLERLFEEFEQREKCMIKELEFERHRAEDALAQLKKQEVSEMEKDRANKTTDGLRAQLITLHKESSENKKRSQEAGQYANMIIEERKRKACATFNDYYLEFIRIFEKINKDERAKVHDEFSALIDKIRILLHTY